MKVEHFIIGIIIYLIGYFTMLYLVKRKNSWVHEPWSKGWYFACLSWFMVLAIPFLYVGEMIYNKVKNDSR